MIQRVQTIWLLLAAAALILTLKTSFYSGTLITDNTFHSVMGMDNYGLMLLTIATATTLFVKKASMFCSLRKPNLKLGLLPL